MFGDPSGMAPEKHKSGGDVLLSSGDLSALLGQYAAASTAVFECIYYQERVFLGFVKYEPDGVDPRLTPLTRKKDEFSAEYGYVTKSKWVQSSGGGGAPAGGATGAQGGARTSHTGKQWNQNRQVKFGLEEVIDSFSFASGTEQYFIDNFLSDITKMYNAEADFFDGLRSLSEPIMVNIVPSSQVYKEFHGKEGCTNGDPDGLGAFVQQKEDGSKTLWFSEEYYTDPLFSEYSDKSKGEWHFYFGYDKSGPHVATSWHAIAHELGHIFDWFKFGHTKFFSFSGNYREWSAETWSNRMIGSYNDRYDKTFKENGTGYSSWYDFLWFFGIHEYE